MDSTKKLINLFYGFETQRDTALKIIEFLKSNKTATPKDLREIEKSKKRFYFVMARLKEIGLVKITRDSKKKVFYTLRPDYFKEKFTDMIKDSVKELN